MKYEQLRKEVRNMQQARRAGTGSFKEMAALHGSKIHTIRYNELQGIYCDTMAIYNGKTIITLENLQYYPAKIKFYYVK